MGDAYMDIHGVWPGGIVCFHAFQHQGVHFFFASERFEITWLSAIFRNAEKNPFAVVGREIEKTVQIRLDQPV